jgi:hypothetical protein
MFSVLATVIDQTLNPPETFYNHYNPKPQPPSTMETIRSVVSKAIKLSAQPPTSGSDSKLGDDFIAIIPDDSNDVFTSDEDEAVASGTVNPRDLFWWRTESVSAKPELGDDFVHVANPSAA